MSGLKLAVLFGLYPNRLGFCGPREASDKDILSRWLAGERISEEIIRNILRGFEGAFPYYKLIAKSNNIKDPFNEKVVSAYWIGNNFLENVSIIDLRETITKEFSKKGLLSKSVAEEKAKLIPATSIPHHSFHVLVIGSVTGRVTLKGKLLDLCRIRCGKVLHYINGSREVTVCYNIGDLAQHVVSLDSNLVGSVNKGDFVAIHWGNVVKVLNSIDVALLKKYTKVTRNSLG